VTCAHEHAACGVHAVVMGDCRDADVVRRVRRQVRDQVAVRVDVQVHRGDRAAVVVETDEPEVAWLIARVAQHPRHRDRRLVRRRLNNKVIRYDARCYFNVRSKADTSQLNLSHGTDNYKL